MDLSPKRGPVQPTSPLTLDTPNRPTTPRSIFIGLSTSPPVAEKKLSPFGGLSPKKLLDVDLDGAFSHIGSDTKAAPSPRLGQLKRWGFPPCATGGSESPSLVPLS